MGRNSYPNSTPEATLHLAQQIHAVATNPGDWGLNAGQLSALQSASAGLGTGISNVVASKAATAAALRERDAEDAACKSAIASIAASIYANKSLTASQIVSLGFAPRKTTKTKVVPVTPTDVVAAIQGNAGVLVKFHRTGNAAGVIFRVEAQATPGGAWAYAGQTTATRLTLGGYLPGERTAFRVIASKNGIDAPPSNVAVIYPAGAIATPTLRLAA